MDRKLPIYTLVLKEDSEEGGVNYVALVDQPAIERNWFAFNEDKEFKFQADEDRKIITGALMIADLPIYRRDDEMGEYYVVFSRDQIEMMVQKFMTNGYQSNVNLMHDPKNTVEGVTMFNSIVVDEQMGISPPRGFEGIPEGSWLGSYKVDNDEVWEQIKEGKFLGFSVEGMFDVIPQRSQLESEIIDIIENIQS